MRYTRGVGKKKPNQRSSENRNDQPRPKGKKGASYTAGELFMAAVGALLIVLFVGIVVTSILGD
jgi:hypothetical protein